MSVDISLTPIAQFGTFATQGSPLGGHRHDQGSSPRGGNGGEAFRQQSVQHVSAQAQGMLATQHPIPSGQPRPVESGGNGPRARNNARQGQSFFNGADIAQAAANAQQQAATTASAAVSTRYRLQFGEMLSGNAEIGYLHGSPGEARSPQSMTHAVETYASVSSQGIMTKALAPAGTGISLQV